MFDSSHPSISLSDSQPSPIQLDYPQQNSGMETTGQDEKGNSTEHNTMNLNSSNIESTQHDTTNLNSSNIDSTQHDTKNINSSNMEYFLSDENNNADINTSTAEYFFCSSDIRYREGYIRTYHPRLVRGATPSSPETEETCKKCLRKGHQADECSTILCHNCYQ